MSDGFDLHICCMGAGYVGGPTMAVIAAKCPKVRYHRSGGGELTRRVYIIILL